MTSPRSTSRGSSDSYAARTGRPHDVGVIGVALFREHGPRYQPCCTGWHGGREDRAAEPAAAAPEANAKATDEAEAQRDDSSSPKQRAQRVEARHRARPSRILACSVRGFPARLVDARRNDRDLLRLAPEPGRAGRAAAAAAGGTRIAARIRSRTASCRIRERYSGSAAPPPIFARSC